MWGPSAGPLESVDSGSSTSTPETPSPQRLTKRPSLVKFASNNAEIVLQGAAQAVPDGCSCALRLCLFPACTAPYIVLLLAWAPPATASLHMAQLLTNEHIYVMSNPQLPLTHSHPHTHTPTHPQASFHNSALDGEGFPDAPPPPPPPTV